MKTPVRRPSRVGEMIRMEISELLPGLRDPRIGLTTITEVKMTPDLKHGKVFISVLGDNEQKKKTLEGLNSAASHIRHEIAARLRLRSMPDLTFLYDESIEYGAHIEELLQKTKIPPDSSE